MPTAAMMLSGASPGGGGAFAGYYKSLTHNHLKLGSSDLTDYPVLITITDPDLKSVSNGGKVNRTDGFDLYFTTTSSGSTKIPFERRHYDPAAGTFLGWVKASSLSHAADGIFGYMRFGDTSITTDQQDSANTWPSFYWVCHIEGPAGSTVTGTSSTGSNDLTYGGGSASVAGKIDGAANGFTEALPAGVATAYAYSYWWKAVSNPGTSAPFLISQMGSVSDSGGFAWSHNNATFRQAAYQQDASSVYSAAKLTSTVVGGTWYLIHVEWDGTTLHAYLNGTQEASAAVASLKTINGTMKYGFSEPGVTEELRLTSGAVRGASWNLADYNSQNDPPTFTTFGATTAV